MVKDEAGDEPRLPLLLEGVERREHLRIRLAVERGNERSERRQIELGERGALEMARTQAATEQIEVRPLQRECEGEPDRRERHHRQGEALDLIEAPDGQD